MALIVEDGSGVAGAESYISVADADTYFAARGNAAWAALTTDQKEQALRKGTDYMEARYRWRGDRVADGQALSWPRSCVYAFGYSVDADIVPERVQRACAELAVRASADDLSPDVGAQVKQETVGPISVTYADGARQTTAYKAVDAMLAPYVYGMGSIPVSRA
ncbi:Phage protein [Lysobacter dokdonensis DS-58]|uniref:Phage protein n=1 Tax=Lysobacter dokdonensis DS-58 TaxID=1300345 RepID=A0A0A2X3U1_9GAMM|nr:DnaT-like ssDNA-binding protein [Lysobacter dokdonensis]KGQ19929.1 Phage protein [Lysobacter dokdonensis DS-58]